MGRSKLQVCNEALLRIGDNSIISLDDNSESSLLCNIHFDSAVESLLSEFSWSSATKRVQLAKLSEDPVFGYPYAYALPADFIRLIQVYDSTGVYSQKYRWNVESGKLLTDISDCYIKYTGNIEDISTLTPLASDALVCKLAMRMSMARTANKKLYEALLNEYENVILKRARSIDSIEDRDIDESEFGNWVSNRGGRI